MSEYGWENAHGTYAVHEGSGIVFVIRVKDGGYGESIAGSGVGREILRLRDALAAERERCAGAAESLAAIHRRGAAKDREAGRGFSASDNEAIAVVLEDLAGDLRQG